MECITSRKNPLLLHIRRIAADAAARRESGEMVCEGRKLLEEAVKCGTELKAVLFSGEPPAAPAGTRLIQTPAELLSSLTSMRSTPDTVFLCARPETAHAEEIGAGRHIVLENVQDPGNVGAVLRTAGAFGMDTVVLLGDCADFCGPKAARASMGAVFRQRVAETTLSKLTAALAAAGVPLWGTGMDADCALLGGALPENVAVAIGSEGRGLSRELTGCCVRRLKIPMDPRCESLNAAVAAGVIMWELRR